MNPEYPCYTGAVSTVVHCFRMVILTAIILSVECTGGTIDTILGSANTTMQKKLHKFKEVIKGDSLYVDENEIAEFEILHPQPFKRDEYLGAYADTHPEDTEPYTLYIKELARNGLKNLGHHGFSASMGGRPKYAPPNGRTYSFYRLSYPEDLCWMKKP